MTKVYERIKTVTLPANTSGLGFAVEVPHWGWLKRLVVKQRGTSNLTNFTVNVYSLPVVSLAVGGQPESNYAADLAKIMPQITASAGQAAYFATDNEGYAYFNRQSGKLTDVKRYIYVHLSVATQQSVNTTWDIATVITTD